MNANDNPSKSQQTLKKLLKATGPIKTFYISLKGAAYTELKITEIHRNPQISRKVEYIKYKGYTRKTTDHTHITTRPYEEMVTNYINFEVDIDQDYKDEAARVARKEGRIQSPCIGEPSENDAIAFLMRIAAHV